MDFKKQRLNKALENKTYRVKLVHGNKGWLAVGLTFVTLFSASVLSTKTVDASAVNNVATANSATSSYVQLYNDVTSNNMHKANRGLVNGTAWKTAKAVKGVDGNTYVLVGGDEYANVDQMDLKDETSKQSLNGIVHVANGNGQYAELYSDPLTGAKMVGNRALAKNTDWKTDQKVVVNGTAYYRVATDEWVKGTEATLISENSRSDKTYLKNAPDAETTSTNNNNSGNTNHHSNGGSTTTPTDPDEMGNITINYIKRSTTTNDGWVIKTETRKVKIGSKVTITAPKLDGYTVVDGEESGTYPVQFDGEEFNIPYTQNDATNVVDTSSVTINYVDEKGNQLAKPEMVPVKVGIDFSKSALNLDGYKLQGDFIQTVKTVKEGNTINFVYSKEGSTTTPTDPETTKTDVTVNYVDSEGNVLQHAKTLKDQEVGSTVSEDALEIPNYKADKPTKTLVVSKDNNSITFTYTKNATTPVDPEVTKADVTIKAVDSDGKAIEGVQDTVLKDQEVGKNIEVSAPTIEGYTATEHTKTVNVDKKGSEVTFTYTKNATTPVDPEVTKADVTIKAVGSDGKAIEGVQDTVLKDQEVGKNIEVSAPTIEGYTATEHTKTVNVDKKGSEVTFTYTKNAEPIQQSTITTRFVDGDGNDVADSTSEKVDNDKSYTAKAVDVKGYTLSGDATQTIDNVTGDVTLTFTYTEDAPVETVDTSAVSAKIVELVNAYRESNGLTALASDSNLEAGSQVRAADEANAVNISGDINAADHEQADGTDFSNEEHLQKSGSTSLAENLAVTNGSTVEEIAQNAFEQWKNSPGHNDNMLNKTMTHTGVAVQQLNNGQFLAMQDFGSKFDDSVWNPDMDNTASIKDLGYTPADILNSALRETEADGRDTPVADLAKSSKTYFGDRVFKSLKAYKKWVETKHNEGSIWDEGYRYGCFLAYDSNGKAIGFVPYVAGLDEDASDLIAAGKTTWTTDYVIPVGQETSIVVNYSLLSNDKSSLSMFKSSKKITGISGDKVTLTAPDYAGYHIDKSYNSDGNSHDLILDVTNDDYTFYYISNDVPEITE